MLSNNEGISIQTHRLNGKDFLSTPLRWTHVRCHDIHTEFHKAWCIREDSQTHREHDDRISLHLLFFFQNEESRLKKQSYGETALANFSIINFITYAWFWPRRHKVVAYEMRQWIEVTFTISETHIGETSTSPTLTRRFCEESSWFLGNMYVTTGKRVTKHHV
jgi:hypothetical protein